MNTIIYIGGFELPDKNAAAQRVIGNAKALRKLGYNVVFIDIDRETRKPIERTKSECFGFVRYSMRYTNNRLTSIDDLKAVLKLYESDEVKVIAYNYPGIALWKMKQYCKKKRIKLYADCTEWYGMLGDNLIKRCIKGCDSYIRMNIVQPKLDGIITISRYLENYYNGKVPTIYIPPLTDITDLKWKNEKNGTNNNEVQIIYAGRPGKHKDKINRIIDAVATLNNDKVKLLIVGITREQFLQFYPDYLEIIDSMNKNIDFKGVVKHEVAIQLLKQSNYSIFYRDITRVTMAGFPTKFAEAMTCGVPILTNRTSDLEEYLIEGINGFWISDDIVSSLERVILNVSFSNLKETIDREMFDYHRFIPQFGVLF